MRDVMLAIEASTSTGSLALLRGPAVIAEAQTPMRSADGERLLPVLVQLLADANLASADLSRIICSAGPGGFTSLRIAAAIGKGLAESLGVELWAMSPLALLAVGDAARGAVDRVRPPATRPANAPGGDSVTDRGGASRPAESTADGAAVGGGGDETTREVIAVLDAMRGEWYAQHLRRGADGHVVAIDRWRILGQEALTALAARAGGRVVGAGAATFPGGCEAIPHARDVARLAHGDLFYPVDIARWEPDYGRLAEAQVKWEQAHGRALEAAE